MKRFLSMLLIATLVLSMLSGCSTVRNLINGKEDSHQDNQEETDSIEETKKTEEETKAPKDPANSDYVGFIADGVYKNPFFEFDIVLAQGWAFLSEEELYQKIQLTNILADTLLGEDLTGAIEDGGVTAVTMATDGSISNLAVTVQKLSEPLDMSGFKQKRYLKNQGTDLEERFKEAGIEIETDVERVTFCGQKIYCLCIDYSESLGLNQKMIAINEGVYQCVITLTAETSEDTEQMLEMFRVYEEIQFIPETQPETEPETTVDEQQVETVSPPDTENIEKYSSFPEKLTAERIATINARIYSYADNGLIYMSEDGKYGILTLDGSGDTGAKYLICRSAGDNFIVVTEAPQGTDTIAAMNCEGLVDVYGNVLIPEEYAAISSINDRFYRACKVTGETDKKSEALVFSSDNSFAWAPDEDDTLYKGEWVIYDITTGKKLEGITGTMPYSIYDKGNCMRYTDDSGFEHWISANGKELPKNANVLGEGYYVVDGDNGSEVYNDRDELLFRVAEDGFVPYNAYGDVLAANKYENGTTKYVIMDCAGNVISAEFEAYPLVAGELLLVDNQVCNYQGQSVIEGTFDNLEMDPYTKNAWHLKRNDEHTIILKDGSILLEFTDTEATYFSSSDFVLRKSTDSGYYSYSHKDKDFTLEGTSVGSWLAEVKNSEGGYDLVDTISGEILITGTDRTYSYEIVEIDGQHIYAYNREENNVVGVYIIR